MKFLSTLVLLATLSVFTEALHHDHVHRSPHNRLMRRGGNGGGGRCRQRPVSTRCGIAIVASPYRFLAPGQPKQLRR